MVKFILHMASMVWSDMQLYVCNEEDNGVFDNVEIQNSESILNGTINAN